MPKHFSSVSPHCINISIPVITKDEIELAYSFFHQKQRVYQYSTLDWQRDDIEYAISSYVETMNRELYAHLAQGRPDFLCSHTTFARDIREAVELLEQMI